MRVSRIQAEENRQTVINVASRLFREHGFDGIGLKDLMKSAGLSQGAFYKQFASKEDLAAQASERALESATGRWSAAAAADPKNPLGAVIAFYLSMGHREERGHGCPVVALGADAARQGADVKASFEAGIRKYLEMLEPWVGEPDGEELDRKGHGHSLDHGRSTGSVARSQQQAAVEAFPASGRQERAREVAGRGSATLMGSNGGRRVSEITGKSMRRIVVTGNPADAIDASALTTSATPRKK